MLNTSVNTNAHSTSPYEHIDAMQDAVRERLAADYDLAVVLTTKWEIKTGEDAEALLGNFLNRLNESLFGNAAYRHGKHINVFSTIEGLRSNKRVHFNCAFELPANRTLDALKLKIEMCWREVNGARDTKLTMNEIYDADGWIRYTTKELRAHYTDCISVHTTWNDKNNYKD